MSRRGPGTVAGCGRRIYDGAPVVRLPSETAANPAGALERACDLADEGRYVLVTGSLYLVGNILGVLEGVSTPGQVSL